MKTKIIFAFSLAMIAFAAISCKKPQQYPMYEAVVTVKTLEPSPNSVFQLDDNTILQLENISGKLFAREVRAMTVYYDKGEIQAPTGSKCKWRSVQVAAVDSIRTKDVVASGAVSNAGIEILKNWRNTIEDGYLTLVFEAKWGSTGTAHVINLEQTADPYTYELKHDNCGDDVYTHYGQGIIAFNLHDQALPTDEDFEFVIRYKGYETDKAIYFQCKNGVFSGPFKKSGEDAAASTVSSGFMFK